MAMGKDISGFADKARRQKSNNWDSIRMPIVIGHSVKIFDICSFHRASERFHAPAAAGRRIYL